MPRRAEAFRTPTAPSVQRPTTPAASVPRSAPPSQVPAARHPDGRVARGERSREAVIEAVLALLGEGDLRPSVAKVARRAGLSERSVFRHFQDIDGLYAAVADAHCRRIHAMHRPTPNDAALGVRIAAAVGEAASAHELSTGVRRAIRVHEPESPIVAQRVSEARRLAAEQIEELFRPELEALDTQFRPIVRALVVAALSGETWDQLRDYSGLDERAAASAVAMLLYSIFSTLARSDQATWPNVSDDLAVLYAELAALPAMAGSAAAGE